MNAKEKKRARDRARYWKKREAKLSYAKAYRKKHPEQVRHTFSAWYKKNKAAEAARGKKWRTLYRLKKMLAESQAASPMIGKAPGG